MISIEFFLLFVWMRELIRLVLLGSHSVHKKEKKGERDTKIVCNKFIGNGSHFEYFLNMRRRYEYLVGSVRRPIINLLLACFPFRVIKMKHSVAEWKKTAANEFPGRVSHYLLRSTINSILTTHFTIFPFSESSLLLKILGSALVNYYPQSNTIRFPSHLIFRSKILKVFRLCRRIDKLMIIRLNCAFVWLSDRQIERHKIETRQIALKIVINPADCHRLRHHRN